MVGVVVACRAVSVFAPGFSVASVVMNDVASLIMFCITNLFSFFGASKVRLFEAVISQDKYLWSLWREKSSLVNWLRPCFKTNHRRLANEVS